ncbi:Uu.00g035010.m01.CDS01 [Anthostomella pinea]|uniref:Uu.00g035010.m01.CDS01 n=1 Tax=Anthostomella pinea TaxID=933095 RepID=A0AAI8V491_9PEZI|nr:Uu.00g035010.m01.CDS01 [Anthostomella pinea]
MTELEKLRRDEATVKDEFKAAEITVKEEDTDSPAKVTVKKEENDPPAAILKRSRSATDLAPAKRYKESRGEDGRVVVDLTD